MFRLNNTNKQNTVVARRIPGVHALHHIEHGLSAGDEVVVADDICSGAAQLHVHLQHAGHQRHHPGGQEAEVHALQSGQRVVVLLRVVVGHADQRGVVAVSSAVF